MRRLLSTTFVLFGVLAACADEPTTPAPLPAAAVAPASRHDALHAALVQESRTFAMDKGDWLEDLGDAPFFGLGSLSRRAAAGQLNEEDKRRHADVLTRSRALLAEELVKGDLQEKVMSVLGLIDHVAATGDRSDLPLIDSFVDRLESLSKTFGDYLEGAAEQSWAVRTYGPTAVTALIGLVDAQYALLIGGERKEDRLVRAVEIDKKIAERAFADLSDATGASVRGFAIAPGRAAIELYPNVSMILLEGRLFRLTHDEAYKLQARAVYAAIQPLKLSDTPARYASPYAAASLKAKTREVSTLSSQNYLALALMVMFEITGEQRFVEEADRVLDGIEKLRGPYCLADVHQDDACDEACGAEKACVASACVDDKCTTGLLHHVVDGRIADKTDPTVFCSGCNLQTLYVVGYRRALAGGGY